MNLYEDKWPLLHPNVNKARVQNTDPVLKYDYKQTD